MKFLAVVFALLFPLAQCLAAERKPNVPPVVADDLRDTLRCHGHPLAKTPQLDRLAARGLAPGGFVIARSMLLETLPLASEAGFSDITSPTLAECGDRIPLCPVVWIGRRGGNAEFAK